MSAAIDELHYSEAMEERDAADGDAGLFGLPHSTWDTVMGVAAVVMIGLTVALIVGALVVNVSRAAEVLR